MTDEKNTMDKNGNRVQKFDEKYLELLKEKEDDGTLRLKLTDDQKDAVLTKGQVLVSAAAGSGKTSTMVKRIILMIVEGYSLRNMLVLVYNVAAANELKEKLYDMLFKKACFETDSELRERFSKELDDLPFCHICTIHSFCHSLIKDNFDKLGLSPTFEVLDEQAHSAYKNEAMENVLSAYAEEGDDAFDDIVEVFSQARKEDNLKSNIIKLHNLIDIQPDKQKFFDNIGECYSSVEDSKFTRELEKYYRTFFKNALQKLKEILEALTNSELKKHIEAIKVAIVFCEEELAAADLNRMISIACNTEKPSLRGVRYKSEDDKQLAAIAKPYMDEVFDTMSELCELRAICENSQGKFAQNKLYVDKLLEITSRFGDELKRLKNENNVLSFEDLQHSAVSLLSEYPELGGIYESVFVDEYQDVNPTQEFIIEKLIRGECFMVGDVKQSIYGFRLADPKIFLARKKKYDGGEGTAIGFNDNFRSKREILAFVNGVFNAVMTEESAEVDYKNDGAFNLKDNGGGRVEVHLFVDSRDEKENVKGLYDITSHVQSDDEMSASKREGEFIADRIQELKGKAKGDDGIIQYGDIAILFRNRSSGAQQIIEVLRKRGIPVDES
ncbi:MAG: UvrD-helicase domain-containing protein, partial [Clostridiales bacterium]|nr:UvrD-helicase domain-containing protein [Clostridiales bacterium]